MEQQITSDVLDVVVNEEMQYSLWPAFKALPVGWKKVGVKGNREVCLAKIEHMWTDMRPLSLQKYME